MGMRSKHPARPEPRVTCSQAAHAVPAPIATLPEWVSRVLPVQPVIPPHAITAEQYAQVAGCRFGHASSVLRSRVKAGELTSGKRGKAFFYWPVGG